MMNQNEKIGLYVQEFCEGDLRRNPLIRMAEIFFEAGDYARTICAAQAALQVPENEKEPIEDMFFSAYVHQLLYQSYEKLGAHQSAAQHFNIALDYDPYNPKYLHDLSLYQRMPRIGVLCEKSTKKTERSLTALDYPSEKLMYANHAEGADPFEEFMTNGQAEWYLWLPEGTLLDPQALTLAYLAARGNAKPVVYLGSEKEEKPYLIERSFVKKLSKVPHESRHKAISDMGAGTHYQRAVTTNEK